ncbi:MAG: hypothetical protein KA715_10110 [Xanthomonadaceae bacterium]|nr:hypothetical protein [Xanthomonadaceae bacterium]
MIVLLMMAAVASAQQPQSCAVEIQKYVHFSSWSKSQNTIKIEADQACMSKNGQPLELKNVTVTIALSNKKTARIVSPQISYMPGFDAFKIGSGAHLEGISFVSDPSKLVIDTKKGEMRTSSGFYLDLSEKQLSFNRKRKLI